MKNDVYIYVLIMAVVTYLIRALPMTLIRREIKSRFIKSFLYYVPFVTLAVMTFPGVLSATDSPISGLIGFAVSVILAYTGQSLFTVSIFACVAVFITELFI